MATIAGIMNLAAPKFSENMDVRDAAAIRSYLYQMQEQLGYILTNLDTSNFAPEMQQTAAASRMAARTSENTNTTPALLQAAAASREAAQAGRKK